ncbi:hypothetical protein EON76_06770 [bacterium]|nr:MAG: hypothetical protein EON76_06770 [bacterium]
MTGSATVTVNPLPTAYNVTGGGSYCSGGSGVVVGLSNSQTGINYQLQNNNVNAGTAIAGTGAAISFGNQTTAGTYTVVATNGTTFCTASMTGNVTVTVNALPTATISYGSTPYCATGTATVTQTGTINGTYSSTTGLIINPSTGAINLGASSAGTYTVTYSFSNGVCANTTTANVTINALPAATVSTTTPTTFCTGGSNGSEMELLSLVQPIKLTPQLHLELIRLLLPIRAAVQVRLPMV